MAELGSPRLGRCTAFAVGTAVAFLGTTHLVHAAPPEAGFGPALTWLAAWVLLGCCAWMTITAVALLVSAVRGPDLLRWCCPRGWRPVVLAAAGAAVAGGVLAPAHADPGSTGGWHPPSLARPMDSPMDSPRDRQRDRSVDRPPVAGSARPVPARPALARPAPAQAGPASATTVVVQPGDSLWRIAARRHPEGDDATVARAVAALYRLNRAAIGADPDLVHPGLRLRRPTPRPTPRPTSRPDERNPR